MPLSTVLIFSTFDPVELSRFAEDFPLTYPIDETYDVSID
ncbi:hypothetical protein VCRA217O134_10003 [Vibrio crassostreae]|nr:hypothetical protein VCRA217O134_10003 [Vibrio crassostreae]